MSSSIIFLVCILAVVSVPLAATEIKVELGQAESRGNRFQIPGDSGTELHMPKKTAVYYRLEAEKEFGAKALLRLVYAPLTIQYVSQADETTLYDQTTFAAGERLKTKFRFDSYRAGYLYRLLGGSFSFWAGVTVKVRDAEIAVEGPSGREKYSNVGFVPLISLKGQWAPGGASGWRMDGTFDGLGSSQGRAFDGAIDVNRDIANWARLGLGWRFLEGGADNKKVENFAHFNYWFASLRIAY